MVGLLLHDKLFSANITIFSKLLSIFLDSRTTKQGSARIALEMQGGLCAREGVFAGHKAVIL